MVNSPICLFFSSLFHISAFYSLVSVLLISLFRFSIFFFAGMLLPFSLFSFSPSLPLSCFLYTYSSFNLLIFNPISQDFKFALSKVAVTTIIISGRKRHVEYVYVVLLAHNNLILNNGNNLQNLNILIARSLVSYCKSLSSSFCPSLLHLFSNALFFFLFLFF